MAKHEQEKKRERQKERKKCTHASFSHILGGDLEILAVGRKRERERESVYNIARMMVYTY